MTALINNGIFSNVFIPGRTELIDNSLHNNNRKIADQELLQYV